jgi:hypothetical protein
MCCSDVMLIIKGVNASPEADGRRAPVFQPNRLNLGALVGLILRLMFLTKAALQFASTRRTTISRSRSASSDCCSRRAASIVERSDSFSDTWRFSFVRQSGTRNPSSRRSHKDCRRCTCAYVHGRAHRPPEIVSAWRQSLHPIQRRLHESLSMLIEIGWKLRVLRAMELYNVIRRGVW